MRLTSVQSVIEPDRFASFSDARERLGRAFADTIATALPTVADALEDTADRAESNAGRRELFAAAAVLRIEGSSRAQRALAQLYDLTFRQLELAQTRIGGSAADLMTLLPEGEVDLQIFAAELAEEIRERVGTAYDPYVRRINALTQSDPPEAMVPLGASTVAVAAIDALHPLSTQPAVRPALRQAAIEILAPRLAELIVAGNEELAARGIRPAPQAMVPLPRQARAAVEVAPPAANEPQEPAAGQDPAPAPDPAEALPIAAGGTPLADEPGLIDRVAAALARDAGSAAVLGHNPLAGSPPVEANFQQASRLPRPETLERDAVAYAHRLGLPPYSRAARQRFFATLRERMQASSLPPAQIGALDLIAGLFDYVIDDDRMPEAGKPLLWRLQQPALTLAALDPGYLGESQRSIRQLIENVGAICVAYADDVSKGSELYQRIDTVVRAVEVVTHSFQSRSSVLDEQVRREFSRAAQGITQLVARVAKERASLEATPGQRNRRDFRRRPSRSRELEVTRRLEAEIEGRLRRHDVPDSVRDFLLGAWMRHLRTALLRDGDQSPEYQGAMQVVDDLLWSLDLSGPRQSRRQLADRIPPLIRLLMQGVADIGAKPEEFRAFLDELFVIHLRKMQRDRKDAVFESGADGLPTLDERIDPTTPVMPTLPITDATHDAPIAPPMSGAAPAATASAPTATWQPASSSPRQPVADHEPPRSDVARPDDRQLLTLLSTLDVSDFPRVPQRLRLSADDAVARLDRFDWLELIGRDGTVQQVKVAWINDRRSVALLVRRPDRRAMSLRMAELHNRFDQRRATLIA